MLDLAIHCDINSSKRGRNRNEDEAEGRGGGKKGKAEHRGVTRRAIKELFIFVLWTQEEREEDSFQIH